MHLLLAAAGDVFQPLNLLILFASVIVGIIIGAIPGLTVNMAVALAVPLTLTMGPTPSILMLLALYCSGVYGGSISAVLINAPGTPASAATSLDGYQLALQGKAGKALHMAIIASVFGGLFSLVILVLIAPQLATVALRFGPAEMTALLLFSLTVVAVLAGDSMTKGLLSAGIGMTLATIGADPLVSVPRFTFGSFSLFDGLPLIPLLIGLFAIGELIVASERSFRGESSVMDVKSADRDARTVSGAELRRVVVPMIRSSAMGVFIGILPGLGASIACFLGYADAKRSSPHPERFGKGAIEGIAAAESANNAVTGSAMIPLLALAIPGDSVTAILLGALLIQGITPGPLIFTNSPEVVYTIYLALFASNIAMAVVAFFALRPIVTILKVPKTILFGLILVVCVAGSYVLRGDMMDVYVMLGAGILSYVLRLFGASPVPLLVAFILTGPLEISFRQMLIGSEGSLLVLFTQPIAALFMGLTAFAVALTWRSLRKRRRQLAGRDT